MKKTMKSRVLFSIASLIIMIFALSVSVFAADKTYLDGKIKESEINDRISSITVIFDSLKDVNKDEFTYFVENADSLNSTNDGMYFRLKNLEKFVELMPEDGLGAYKSYDISDIKEINDSSVMTDVVFTFEKQEIVGHFTMTYFPNFEGMDITKYDFEAGKSLVKDNTSFADKMKEAGTNTLLGMGTVFCVLILISLLISCFAFIPKIQAAFQKKNEIKDNEADNTSSDSKVTVTEEEVTDDLELIAVISAAIAAAEQTTTDGFVVRSIRRR